MKKKKYIGLLACSLAAMLGAVLLAGCSGVTTASNDDKSLTIALSSNGGTSLDPTDNYEGWFGLKMGIYETLFKVDSNFAVQPMLADSYTQVDATTWKLHVRDGVTFQNGKSVDAAAVKASLSRMIAANSRGAKALDIADMKADGQDLTITTTGVNATFINELCEPVCSIIDVDSGTDNVTDPIGTGPYAVDSIDAVGNCTLTRYDDYWQGKPKIATLNTKFIVDDAAKISALQSGEIQAATTIASDQVALFSDTSRYSITQNNNGRTHMLYFNMDSSTMQDKAVRQALSMCVDRDAYVDGIYAGSASSTEGCFPETSGFSDGVSAPGYDLEKAKQILQQAGYADTDGDGYLDKDGKKLTLTFATYQANAELPKICEVMSSTLKSIGVDVKIEVADKIAARLSAGDWDVATMAYNTLPTGDGLAYLKAVMGTGSSANYGHYTNPAVDSLLDQMTKEADVSKRKSLAEQIQEKALGDYAYVYMVHIVNADVTAASVTNLSMDGQYYYVNYLMDVNS